jgi:hypothetical protein
MLCLERVGSEQALRQKSGLGSASFRAVIAPGRPKNPPGYGSKLCSAYLAPQGGYARWREGGPLTLRVINGGSPTPMRWDYTGATTPQPRPWGQVAWGVGGLWRLGGPEHPRRAQKRFGPEANGGRHRGVAASPQGGLPLGHADAVKQMQSLQGLRL